MCAANLSEGRDPGVLAALRLAAGVSLLDLHHDEDHHRSVLTLVGGEADLVPAVLSLCEVALARIDLRRHAGVHPRFGALDVVPFAPLAGIDLAGAVHAREAALEALGGLGIPAFRYGPLPGGAVRTLPELRRLAFVALAPDTGPRVPHPTAGAVAVGARRPLLAWNLWIQGATIEDTRAAAVALRGPAVRALGLQVKGATQVSCNLLDAESVTPKDVYERALTALPDGAHVVRCELVGLVPRRVLEAVPESWWERLGLAESACVESRAAAAGLARD